MTVTCWKCGKVVKVERSSITYCPRCGVVAAIVDKKTGEVVKVK